MTLRERALLNALEELHAALRHLPPDSHLRTDNDAWSAAVELFADAMRWRLHRCPIARPLAARSHETDMPKAMANVDGLHLSEDLERGLPRP